MGQPRRHSLGSVAIRYNLPAAQPEPMKGEMKMPGYVIGQLKELKDSDAFNAYQSVAGPTVAQYGGKLVLNSFKVDAGDGGWSPTGMVIIEFESADQARKWYHSPEYQAVIGQRTSSTDSALIIVDGE